MSGRAPAEHPALELLRALCAELPETSEVMAWGHPTFRVRGKIFASFEGYGGDVTVCVKATRPDQAVLVEDPRFFVAPYVGRYGWVCVRAERVARGALEDLARRSYALVAPKRLAAAAEAGAAPAQAAQAGGAKAPARGKRAGGRKPRAPRRKGAKEGVERSRASTRERSGRR